MYAITDEQIEYILNDIRRNGIEMEDLQSNLLDHICCILEQELKENDDFERFYHQTIKKFYKKELAEIEEETINLLTFKNYYAMKKSMTLSGFFAVGTFIAGSFFKIMFWPGAAVLFGLAILSFSFVFLPLLFMLKTKEANNQRDKWILRIGTLVGVLYCMSTWFLIQRWPGSRIVWLSTLAITFFILVPMYFFTGIRKPETKMNTIVTTVLLIGFLGLQFAITSIRNSPMTASRVYTYLQTESLLDNALQTTTSNKSAQDIQNTCERIKLYILQNDLGMTTIPQDFEETGLIIKERNADEILGINEGPKLLSQLRQQVEAYNSQATEKAQMIPLGYTILAPGFVSKHFCSSLFVLNNVAQLQLFLANTQPATVAVK